MSDATPRPWKLVEATPSEDRDYTVMQAHLHIDDFDTVMHNETYYNHAPSKANAELIVRAVNSHALLLEAAEAAWKACDSCHGTGCAFPSLVEPCGALGGCCPDCTALRTAINAAKGNQQ